jgi:hypothetical protein
MGELITYLHALFTNWAFLMSAGPFLGDRLITWFWPTGRAWLDDNAGRRRKKVGLWLVAAGVFAAGFITWRDEHRKVSVSEPRSLSATESLCISRDSQPLKERLKYLMIARTPDHDSALYAVDFYDAFRAAGIDAALGDSNIDSREQHGVMIAVSDPANPPETAKRLVDILEGKCKISIRLTRWRFAYGSDEFMIFIAPPKR